MDQVKACTSIQFDGVIAVLKPKESWVARWQRNGTYFISLCWVCFRWWCREVGRDGLYLIAS